MDAEAKHINFLGVCVCVVRRNLGLSVRIRCPCVQNDQNVISVGTHYIGCIIVRLNCAQKWLQQTPPAPEFLKSSTDNCELQRAVAPMGCTG